MAMNPPAKPIKAYPAAPKRRRGGERDLHLAMAIDQPGGERDRDDANEHRRRQHNADLPRIETRACSQAGK
jgi:hypothetical protein